MNDVRTATIKLNNSISKLDFDTIDSIELHDKDIQLKQSTKVSKFINSFDIFTTVSFIKISKFPIWFFLGRPFDVYTTNDQTMNFFKKLISLTVGRDAGLLVKGDVENYKFNDADDINKDEFYFLLYVCETLGNYNIKAVPLQLSDYFIVRYLKNCKLQDRSSLQTSIFIEPMNNNNDKNDILDKYAGRTTSHPFTSVGSQLLTSSVKQQFVIPKSNLITDQEGLKKKILSFINSELRMRNINSNDKDYQALINNAFKSAMFAFRHDLNSNGDTRIKIDDVREVVIKLMDIFV